MNDLNITAPLDRAVPEIEINMLALSDYTIQEIELALERNKKIIAEKSPNTRATTAFWKAVENRQKLVRELVVRRKRAETETLPADRRPLLQIEIEPE